MSNPRIQELQRLFVTRLDTLGHVLRVGEEHLGAQHDLVNARLAPDMLPLGIQVAFACNQPRGFSQWCAGLPVENIDPAVASLAVAHGHIADTRARVMAMSCGDDQLDQVKRIGLGPGRSCELVGHAYVSEYLLPNLYFHVTTTYAILRMLGAPLGKADYLQYLAPHIRQEG